MLGTAFNRVHFLITWFLLILTLHHGSTRSLKPKGLTWKSMPLKPVEIPIFRDPPGEHFQQRRNKPETPKHVDPKELRKMLKKFEPLYMSFTKPEVNLTEGTVFLSRREILASMPEELKKLHFTVPGSDRGLGDRASKKLRLWLWNLSSCEVLPLWKDFGPTIRPRYVNIGQCSMKNTCSYPKGMRCKPTKYKRIYTLFWVCSKAMQFNKGTPCAWVPYPTDVIEKCKCSC